MSDRRPLPGEKRGRRWYMAPVTTDLNGVVWWWWCSWRLFERVCGTAPGEEHARGAIEHFLESPSTYKQGARDV